MDKPSNKVRGLKDLMVGQPVEVLDQDKDVWVRGTVVALYTRPNRAIVEVPGQVDPDIHSQPWACIRRVC